jgi:N-acetylneuraminic acid mutarotase
MEPSNPFPEEEHKKAMNIQTKSSNTSWVEIHQTSKVPSQRSLHVSVVLADGIYIFGGYDGTQRTNDLYRYDLEKSEWQQISPTNMPPSPRDRHAAIVYQNGIYIFGGFDGVNRVNDFYCYDLAKNEWVLVPNKGTSLYLSKR